MEGILYKWTNYLTGWQPRWFILDNGILSYYDSQDDVNKGSKGSIKMAVCEIKVHPTDSTRMELIIPGEQHFYVKSVNAAERQRWLVALGSSKACLTDTRTKKEKEISETNESLKTKMSELRLYCDLLMQQVHTIQESVRQDQPSFSPSAEMKRSISHPGTILYDRKLNTNHQKEAIIVTPHGEEHRRIWAYSGAESCGDSVLEHAEKTAQISCSSSPTANGEFPPMAIPEENIANSRNKLSETESPFVALSS
ncbi:pleckstrin homology domain-containing family A member 3 isoform X4 [Mustelus asterias]